MMEIYDAEIVGGVHGVTCVFPTLQSVVDYEEKKRVPNQGYPRFIAHPFVKSIQIKEKRSSKKVIATQSLEAAKFVHSNYFDKDTKDNSWVEARNDGRNNYGLIYVDEDNVGCAISRVCNSGIILNSRKAERILNNCEPPEKSQSLPKLLSDLERESNPNLTFVYTSGMAAVYDAITSMLLPGTRAAVIGNTYVDTSKIFENLSNKSGYKPTVYFSVDDQFHLPDSTSVVFLEVPTNPLLEVADLESIVSEAHGKGASVIVDSTIASPHHYSPFEFGADIVIHSTTKSLSGKNNHMGGVLFVNPSSYKLAEKIHPSIFMIDEEESLVLEDNLRSFPERIKTMAENGRQVADYLRNIKCVSKIYYPDKLNNSNGHVISFELKDDDFKTAEAFYDNCTLFVKGPSMGYEKTMLMPYTLITHFSYSDDDLIRMGLKRHLMRLSVGTECVYETIRHLSDGFKMIKSNRR